MALFKIKDLQKKEAEPTGTFTKSISGKTKHIIASQASQLAETIQNLEHDVHYHFCTAGSWSLHDMIAIICEKIGPSKLYLTTWTISEEPMRMLFKLIDQGLITEMDCLFDYRIEKRKAEAFQLAKVNSSRIKLIKIHAKVAVLVNEDWAVTITGSANLTKNPRIEAGTISTMRETAEFHSAWITNEIEHGNTFRK